MTALINRFLDRKLPAWAKSTRRRDLVLAVENEDGSGLRYRDELRDAARLIASGTWNISLRPDRERSFFSLPTFAPSGSTAAEVLDGHGLLKTSMHVEIVASDAATGEHIGVIEAVTVRWGGNAYLVRTGKLDALAITEEDARDFLTAERDSGLLADLRQVLPTRRYNELLLDILDTADSYVAELTDALMSQVSEGDVGMHGSIKDAECAAPARMAAERVKAWRGDRAPKAQKRYNYRPELDPEQPDRWDDDDY